MCLPIHLLLPPSFLPLPDAACCFLLLPTSLVLAADRVWPLKKDWGKMSRTAAHGGLFVCLFLDSNAQTINLSIHFPPRGPETAEVICECKSSLHYFINSKGKG